MPCAHHKNDKWRTLKLNLFIICFPPYILTHSHLPPPHHALVYSPPSINFHLQLLFHFLLLLSSPFFLLACLLACFLSFKIINIYHPKQQLMLCTIVCMSRNCILHISLARVLARFTFQFRVVHIVSEWEPSWRAERIKCNFQYWTFNKCPYYSITIARYC